MPRSRPAGSAGAGEGGRYAGPMTPAFFRSTESGHALTELPLEPVWYGVIALGAFLALLALLWSFRNTLQLDRAEHDDTDPGRRGTSR